MVCTKCGYHRYRNDCMHQFGSIGGDTICIKCGSKPPIRPTSHYVIDLSDKKMIFSTVPPQTNKLNHNYYSDRLKKLNDEKKLAKKHPKDLSKIYGDFDIPINKIDFETEINMCKYILIKKSKKL